MNPLDRYMVKIQTGELVDAINSGNLELTRNILRHRVDLNFRIEDLECDPGLAVPVPNYDVVNMGIRCRPKSVLGCAILQNNSQFVLEVLEARVNWLEFVGVDKLLALEHCSVEVFQILLNFYGDEIGRHDVSWCRWRKRDFLGNLIIGRMETETVSNTPLNVVVKSLGYCCRLHNYYQDGRLMEQVEKLKMVYTYGNFGNSLLITLLNHHHKFALKNLLRWGVLDCRNRWDEAISSCIQMRAPYLLNVLMKFDTSSIPPTCDAHLSVLSESINFAFLNGIKVEKLLRILINANFSFYGVPYDVGYDDSITKLLLLHFAGATVTDHENVMEKSWAYARSLSARSLIKLPILFETVEEAGEFAKSVIKTHNAKRLSFLCKLSIRKCIGPCRNLDILEDRVNTLPAPKMIQSFLSSSLI